MLNPVDDALIEKLRAALPDGSLRPPEPRDLEEPRGKWHGQAGIVVSPRNTEQVAEVIRQAGQARVGVVPISGGTGLVAGQVATQGPPPILLSLDRMNAVRGVWPSENALVAEAGDDPCRCAACGRWRKPPVPTFARLGRDLPDRRQPQYQRRRRAGPALWQRTRSVSGAGGGAAERRCLARPAPLCVKTTPAMTCAIC